MTVSQAVILETIMIWTNDNLPESIAFPMGPVDIDGDDIYWDPRYGPEPDDIEEFIRQSA